MIAIDKQAHFYAGLAICLAASLFVNPIIGLVIAITAAIAKEAWDALGHGTPDVMDAVATSVGGVLGFGLIMISEVL